MTRATGSQIASPYTARVAAVTAMPMNENPVIVSGSPMLCPTTCDFWSREKRVKSGMLSDSVIQ